MHLLVSNNNEQKNQEVQDMILSTDWNQKWRNDAVSSALHVFSEWRHQEQRHLTTLPDLYIMWLLGNPGSTKWGPSLSLLW